ncbi:MAG: ABC transporter substrate-binding protein [Sutterellaceae bacterium]|nr:ABC transporter substrate-binding protein [Sutterellaceae bacterium]
MTPSVFAANKSVKIAVGGKALYYYLPISIAERLGYFKDEGLDVQIIDFQGGSRSLQAVVGGSADVVSGAFEHTISMQSKGQSMKAFVLQGRAPQVVFAVNKKTMPNFKSLKDLRGKKIGVTAPGSSSHAIANFVLGTEGIKPNEVSFIGVGASSAAVAAIRSGQIDAFTNLDPVIAQLQKDDLLTIVADTRKIDESDKLFGGPMVAGCLYAPTRYIEKNPDIIQGLTNAVVRADRWLAKATPEELVATVPESYFLGNKEIYIEGFLKNRPALSPDGAIPDEAPAISMKALQEVNDKFDASKVDLKACYTNEFVQKAHAKYPA